MGKKSGKVNKISKDWKEKKLYGIKLKPQMLTSTRDHCLQALSMKLNHFSA